MDLAAILLLIAVLVVVGLFLAAPLLTTRGRRIAEETLEASSLMAERDRVITALQELDFDNRLGKVPAEDYPLQRSELLEKGTEILRKLDALAPPSRRGPQDAEARLERAAAGGRADSAGMSKPLEDDEIESMLALRRSTSRRAKSAGFCPRCGKPVLITDQFCPNCGKALI